jgi:protoheme IX farnesyltransferase
MGPQKPRTQGSRSDEHEHSQKHHDGENRQKDRGVILGGAGARKACGIALAADRFSPGDGGPASNASIVQTPHKRSLPLPDGDQYLRESRPSDEFKRAIVEYLKLTKPRIVALLLITTVPSMILARRGLPPPWLIAATLIGGTVAAGGSNAVNQYVDRDIDRVMRRTRRRPVPRGTVDPRNALAFGIALGLAGVLWLAIFVNVFAAWLTASAFAFYVFVYTLWLKRRSPLNIVIGGAAGGVPVLVGWAAVTGHVGTPAMVLFSVVFLWTPPHFWALAMRYEHDYAAAGVPMLPVISSPDRTTRQIFLYALATVAASLVLYPVASTGPLYLGFALILGAWFIGCAVRLRGRPTPAAAMAWFRASINYLSLLFLGLALDTLAKSGI